MVSPTISVHVPTAVISYWDAGFVTLFSLLSYEPIGIALPTNDPLMVNWSEHFLQRMEALGVMDEISARWFGEYADAIKPE